MNNAFLSDVWAGRARTPRMKLFASVASLLFCMLFAGSLLLGQPPVRVADAASRTIACGNTFGLIDAINDANATPEADTIALTLNCIYQLTGPQNTDEGANGLPSITAPLTILGNGATILRVTSSPTPSFRIFRVSSSGDLTLINLKVRNGSLQSSSKNDNQAVITGGAILNSGGKLTIKNSVISNNATVGQKAAGGAIQSSGAATTTIINSTLDHNSATFGGAIAGSGTTTILSSTLSLNTASRDGGALLIGAGAVAIVNSTLSGNTATSNGGGIAIDQASAPTVSITNSTLADNRAKSGGGIYRPKGGTITLRNTIVASASGGNCVGITSGGHNLSSDGSCGDADDDLLNTDPRLDPLLADNGGPTYTRALLPGSPAIDKGDTATCAAAPVSNLDQRGQSRPKDGDGDGSTICDIGAFELST